MVSLARLQDVERQLSTAATALRLHLRGLKSEREHIGWAQIAALALVCGRIEQAQSELRQSTTEILALARRSLAGGDAANKGGEDTETEDEDEDVGLEADQSVKGEARGQVEEAEAAIDQVQRCGGQEEASEEEEQQNEAVVKLELVELAEDFTRDGVVEEEIKESDDGSSRQVVDGVESRGEEMICVSDVEVKREMISRSGSVEAGEQSSLDELEQLCDATVETDGVEVAVEEISSKKEEGTQEVGVEITEAECRQGGSINYGKSKHSEATEESSELAMENEGTAASDTINAPNEAECGEDHAEVHTGGVETTTAEPKSTESESVTESEEQAPRMDVKSADTSPIETTETSHHSRTATMDTPDSKKDEERDGTTERIAHMNQWANAVAKLQSTALRDCLQAGNSVTAAVTDLISTTDRFLSEAMQREPKFNCRLWIERMIVTLNNLFEMINDPNVLETFSALRENLPKLKRYCQEHYPDYISDMLNDLKSIEYLEQEGKLNSSILAMSTRFVLDQLREDCVKYSVKLSTDNPASRNDEHWKQLMLICKHLVTWIKEVPLPHEQFPAGYLTQTIQVLGAFDARVPKRIPVDLLENMIFMVQKTKTNDSPRIATENDLNTASVEAVGRTNSIDTVNGNRAIEQKPTKDAVVRGDCEETKHASVTVMETTHDRDSITDNVGRRDDKNREVPDEVCENEVKNTLKTANQKAADAINEFRRCLKNRNCTADGAVSLTIVVRDMTSAVTSHDSKYSRRMWIEEVVEACHWILRGVQGAELAQAVSPLNEYCKQLQLYSSRFPDCLQDILNDIKYVDARQLNSSQLASWLSRLLQRLRKDCCVYYQKVKGSTSELRSDEHWKLLMLICERISEWIKQLSPADFKKYEDDLQKALKILTSFNKHFPSRIPTALLEIMRHAVGSSDVPNSVDNSTSKKRLRDDSGCVGPEQKKGAHHSSRDKFNPIAKRYLQVAGDAKIMIVDTGSRITEPSAAKAFSDLKAITTLANAELLKIFKSDDIPSANTTGCYRLATQFMVETISKIPGNVGDFGWVGRTTLFLRQLLYLGESTILMNERDSLSESISVLEAYLKATYEVEGDVVPSLDAIEARLHRFKTNKWDLRTVKRPIQSISSGLLVDVKKINALGAEKYLVRSAPNWSRFTAVCYALLVWTMRARKLAIPRSGLLNHLLPELLEFDAKYPSKLPPSLISNCQAISW